MDEHRKIGEPSHRRIEVLTSNYRTELNETMRFLRTRMANDDFISITITRDCHNTRDNGKLKVRKPKRNNKK